MVQAMERPEVDPEGGDGTEEQIDADSLSHEPARGGDRPWRVFGIRTDFSARGGPGEDTVDEPLGQRVVGAERLGRLARSDQVDRVAAGLERLQVVGHRQVGAVDPAGRLGLMDELGRARPATGA